MNTTWREILEHSGGEYHIYCKTLETGYVIEHQADTSVNLMSVIKLPILLTLLDEAQNGRLSLHQTVRVSRSDVGRNGSGLMQYMYLGTRFSLYNLAFLMMSVSDNTATNVLLRILSKEKVNAYLKRQGLKHTRLNLDKLDFPFDRKKPNPPLSAGTAHELAELMERLLKHELLPTAHTNIALRLLSEIQKSVAVRRVTMQLGKEFGSKTGSSVDHRQPLTIFNECGYLITRSGHTHVFAVFSLLPTDAKLPYSDDAAWRIEFADLAATLFTELEAN